ncbi:LamG domain-containing protein [Candidatus Nanosalina sp. VS9-1]|uniref:LamG domain-containing protein n=1 Tax=Candidatus Nanosalina sp. VS9-1 TaxID=3388566 RepID=UPI0039E0AD96
MKSPGKFSADKSSRLGIFLGLAVLLALFSSSGAAWFDTYDFRRDIVNNTTSSLIIPLQESDIDENGVNETFYGQPGEIYFNNDTDFAFVDNSGQRCGFQTSPEMKKNCENLDTGLVSYYPFDNSQAWDAINGENGSLNGVSSVSGKFGEAFDFNGGDYVSIPAYDGALDFSEKRLRTDFTISLWFKTTDSDGGIFSVQGTSNPGNPDGHDRHIYLSGGDLCARLWDDGSNNAVPCISGNFADGEWHHVTFRPVEGDSTYLYADGTEYSAQDGANTVSDFNGASGEWSQLYAIVGHSQDASGGYLTGTVEDVRIYDTPLTESEIQAYYDATRGERPSADFGRKQGGAYSTSPSPPDSSTVWYNESLEALNLSAKYNDISNSSGYLAFKNSGSLVENVSVGDEGRASTLLEENFQPNTVYNWSAEAVSSNESLISSTQSYSFTTGNDFTDYSNVRKLQNFTDSSQNLRNTLVLPVKESDIDRNGKTENFYGQASRIYYDSEESFEFANKIQTCGFQTNPEKISSCPPTGKNLISYWPLDGDTGWDPVGGRNGSLTNVTTEVDGAVNQAYSFDGNGSYFNATVGNLPEAYTIGMWIKTTERSQSISGFSDDVPFGGSHEKEFYIDSNGRVVFRGYDGNDQIAVSDQALDDGEWHHVMATAEDDDYVRLYVDGQQVDRNSVGTLYNNYDTGYFTLGIGSELETYYNGSVDDVRIYRKKLKAEDIQDLYNYSQKGKRPYFTQLDGSLRPAICDDISSEKCISNRTHSVSGEAYDIDSEFESKSTAVFEAFQNSASISVNSSARISGLWRGIFDLNAERITLTAGARFRPVNGTIRIG